MTPAARWRAVAELLAEIGASLRPADSILNDWGRSHRFAGAKDRSAIFDRVFAILRRRAELIFAAGSEEPRALVLASLLRLEGGTIERIEASLAAGGPYGAAALSSDERAMLRRAARKVDETWPASARANLPEWLIPEFRTAFGDRMLAEAEALTGRAPLDLRVNRLQASRQEAEELLAGEGIDAEPCPFSPVGLRVIGRRQITATRAFREGIVEVQDEGSQIAAACALARPGQVLADLCAGAGGKTLAIAAEMQDRGHLYAFDRDPDRLARLRPRAARAGTTIVEARVLDPLADDGRRYLAGLAGQVDCVLVDVPCSGSGSWRRRPEEKWRLRPERLEDLHRLQRGLLEAAADLVRIGGRIVYVTCSVLPTENEGTVCEFLSKRTGVRPIAPAAHIPNLPWDRVTVRGTDHILLSPARTGTDGFFIAGFERMS